MPGLRTVGRALCLVSLFALAPCLPGTAAAALPVEQERPSTFVRSADVEGFAALAPVHDRVLSRPKRSMLSVRLSHEAVFTDEHGHAIRLETTVPALDLTPYGEFFAGILHYDEIEELLVTVVAPAEIEGICGAGAAACYLAEDPANSYRGQIWIPSEHPDLAHIMVHEYGHHVDNQLTNISHLGGCSYDSDGSRNWFFERNLEDDILGTGFGCSADTEWEYLLGELYAEDFARLNGSTNWVLPGTRSPTQRQLDALAYDFRYPFQPRSFRDDRRVARRRVVTRQFRVDSWTFLTATLTGTRASDLDLYLFKRNADKPLARSERRGSNERIERILAPGKYDIVYWAYQKKGAAHLRVSLD